MAITGPKSDQSIGYVSRQFNDQLRLLLTELEATKADEQRKKEETTGKILFALGGLKQIKDYRDEFLSDKLKEETIFAGQEGEKVMRKYVTAPPKEGELFKGKYLQRAKDFIYEPDLVLNPQLKDAPLPLIEDKEGNKVKRNEVQRFEYLKSQGFSDDEASKALDVNFEQDLNKAKEMRKKARNDAAMMQLKDMSDVFDEPDLVLNPKYQSLFNPDAIKYQGDIPKKSKGGKLVGPSHAKGGILTQVGDQPIEMEGGEYVIRKSSVKKLEKSNPGLLAKLNKTGKMPKKASNGGPLDDYLEKGIGAFGDIQSLRGSTDTLGTASSGLSLSSRAFDVAGKGSASQALGGASQILGGIRGLDSTDETGITQAQSALGIAQGVESVASTVAPKAVGTTAGTVLGKAAPVLGIASGVKDVLNPDTTATQKIAGGAGAVAGTATLASAAGTTAAANFYNPVGWVAGAVAAGATLAGMMGVGSNPQNINVKPTKINL